MHIFNFQNVHFVPKLQILLKICLETDVVSHPSFLLSICLDSVQPVAVVPASLQYILDISALKVGNCLSNCKHQTRM